MTGTLEEVIGKLFDLYLENRIEAVAAKRYLLLLRNPSGEQTFSEEDADRLLDMLLADKEEAENYVAGPKPEDYFIKHIENARTREDLDRFEEAVSSLRKGFRETQAFEDVLVQTKRLDVIAERRKKGKW